METAPVKRPKWNDDMLADLSGIVAKWLVEWDGSLEEEDCMKDCMKVLKYRYNDDGYDLAKGFEHEGYSPDARLVEVLEGVCYEASTIKSLYHAKWIADNTITPKLSMGSTVSVKDGHVLRTGEIVKIDEKLGKYTVNIPELGHVKTGYGTYGHVIDFEDVEILNQQ